MNNVKERMKVQVPSILNGKGLLLGRPGSSVSVMGQPGRLHTPVRGAKFIKNHSGTLD